MNIAWQCVFCTKTFTRDVTWFDPKLFLGRPQMLITIWCPNTECQLSNTITVRFGKDGNVLLKKVQDTSAILGQQIMTEEVVVTARPKTRT